ncbi:MAG: tetratricopeptide repeat protein, partial [Anaerolineales bacterium]|nr:tetratricopeptide repeat protein [Anaerolineales bacterium]
MANIALRDYNQEIEAMINDGRFDEAIAHCLHILKLYPKHITTYRQLGNAFLEAKRYDDALDIFQRLLSAVPDDFIANLGMSIIREDEGNLDAAIWYMERAFEQKPSNKAIQEELRRLYGRRDRVEPSKIRLTRGALARMYTKGDQIPQAIAEINAALSEDTQRPDLQILLASVYHQAGKDGEASETCRALLDKLPDCLVANYILVEILEKSGKVDEAKPCREKLQAMEPYEVKVSPQAPVADQVPADAIIIPKLDITDDQISKVISQPAWASSLGIVASDFLSGQEEIPEWSASVEKPEEVQE